MDDARRLVLEGAPHGSFVVAEEQSGGRGRLQRRWVSPRGGLYMTVVLEAPTELEHAWRAGFAAALAAREALLELGGPAVSFDWPNDLMLGPRKVGGILSELVTPAPGEPRAPVVLVGVGLNVGPDPAAVEPAAAGPAGTLTLPGDEPRAALAARLSVGLLVWSARCWGAGEWPAALESLARCCPVARGGAVRVRRHDGSLVEGVGVGLAQDGALCVQTSAGEVVPVRYGELAR
jgi:BirA family biotin operon repressor/biotin-[acetyl-CoA-carboxylase] ligase